MNSKDRVYLVLLTVSVTVYFPFAHWISTTRVGTSLFLWGVVIYGFLFLAAVPAIPLSLIALFYKRLRGDALLVLVLSLVYIPLCIAGIYFGREVRMARMADFAERSQPLIEAIQKYERNQGAPPATLDDLIPDYLSEIPHTGMMAYPEYEYYSGKKSLERYDGNPWVVTVDTPSGGPNWDEMLYFPKQNYPKAGYGGDLERVGDWAYVHE